MFYGSLQDWNLQGKIPTTTLFDGDMGWLKTFIISIATITKL